VNTLLSVLLRNLLHNTIREMYFVYKTNAVIQIQNKCSGFENNETVILELKQALLNSVDY